MKKISLLAGVLGVLAAAAETYHWTGAENGFWTNANNWAEGTVPGRWYGRAAEGHLVTNGAPCDVVYFGDAVKGAKATTISFDGVHSISNLLTTGRTVRYTYGTAATQYVPIAALGTFSAGETADTLVATVASPADGYGLLRVQCQRLHRRVQCEVWR